MHPPMGHSLPGAGAFTVLLGWSGRFLVQTALLHPCAPELLSLVQLPRPVCSLMAATVQLAQPHHSFAPTSVTTRQTATVPRLCTGTCTCAPLPGASGTDKANGKGAHSLRHGCANQGARGRAARRMAVPCPSCPVPAPGRTSLATAVECQIRQWHVPAIPPRPPPARCAGAPSTAHCVVSAGTPWPGPAWACCLRVCVPSVGTARLRPCTSLQRPAACNFPQSNCRQAAAHCTQVFTKKPESHFCY